jgi:hypothetical protein
LSLLGIASSVVALFTIKEPSRKAIVANDEDDNGKKVIHMAMHNVIISCD